MSFQVLAVEEGGRRVIEKSWEDIEEEMIVSSRREQTKRWAYTEGNVRSWAGWEEQRLRERQIEGGRAGKEFCMDWGKLITSDLSDIICWTNCRAAAGGNGELKV